MYKLGKNLILIVITLIVTIGLCEVFVRMFVTVRNIGPSFTVYDPIYGKRIKKNISVTRITPEFKMRFTTNSLGFRGPELESVLHRPILFLGDSFTMGYGVNDGEEFPALVRKALSAEVYVNKIPVVNAGIGDNGNGRWIKFLKREVEHYNPRLVVLQLIENDFSDNVREHLFDLTPSGQLHECKVPPPGLSRKVQNFIEKVPSLSYLYLVSLGRQIKWLSHQKSNIQREKDSEHMSFSYAERLTFCIVKEVLWICRNHNLPVLGLIVGVEGRRLSELEKLFSAHGAQLFKVPNKKQQPSLYYNVDGHWNKSGHVFTANLVLEKLRKFYLAADRWYILNLLHSIYKA